MESLLVAVGWVGQAAFFSRFFVQWISSERAGRSVAPRIFWWLSLLGSVGVGAYALHRGEPVLLVGIAMNAAIYGRNLWIAYTPGDGRRLSPLPLALLAALIAVALFTNGVWKARDGWSESAFWLTCVVVGQGIWSSRFVVQWWFTERKRESHFPTGFWWLSLAGNAMLLAYALHLRDPIFVAGFVPGPLVQVRNLVLTYRERRRGGPPVEARETGPASRELHPAPRRPATDGADSEAGGREPSDSDVTATSSR